MSKDVLVEMKRSVPANYGKTMDSALRRKSRGSRKTEGPWNFYEIGLPESL